MAKTATAVTPAPVPGSKAKEAFLDDLLSLGIEVEETADLAQSIARYTASKCQGDTVIGYLWDKRQYRGGAPDKEGNKHGWIGYTIRLLKECHGIMGNSDNEKLVLVDAGEDIIVGENALLKEQLDKLYAASKDKCALVAIAPSHQEKAKVGQKWVFHFRQVLNRDKSREELGLPEWQPFAYLDEYASVDEDENLASFVGNDSALEKLANGKKVGKATLTP